MEVTVSSLEWDSNDVLIWREFLKTPTGLRLIPKLLESVPSLLSKGDTNEILIRSGEVRGVQLAVQTVISLTAISPSILKATLEYPDLEDDDSWGDGHKLEQK